MKDGYDSRQELYWRAVVTIFFEEVATLKEVVLLININHYIAYLNDPQFHEETSIYSIYFRRYRILLKAYTSAAPETATTWGYDVKSL